MIEKFECFMKPGICHDESHQAEARAEIVSLRARVMELEKRDVVPRSRFDVACAQYTECEEERKRLFDRCRDLEAAP